MSGDYAYEGADYGLDPEYGSFSQSYSSNLYKNLSLNTDPRTANQLKAASDKLNTGVKSVEVTMLSPDIFESIPKQHFEELNRLRKLAGNVELTLHAPIIEPTGISQKGWDKDARLQAERQMFNAVEKAHELNPQGNVVTTFHASAIGQPAETVVWEGEGEKRKVVRSALIIDENNGVGQISLKPEYLEAEPGKKFKEITVEEKIKEHNQDNWNNTLQQINYHAEQGARIIEVGTKEKVEIDSEGKKEIIDEKARFKLYKDFVEGKGEKFDKLKNSPAFNQIQESMQTISNGDIYLRNAYDGLRKMYDQAYETLKNSDDKEGLDKLDEFRKKIQGKKLDYLKDPEHLGEFSNILREGVHIMRSIEVPQVYKPLKAFAIDKSAETFSNVALQSFKKFGENSPILSLENPPAGQALITSGEDLRRLIDESRNKFKIKAVKELGLSASKAEEEANKIIGATWDVGHINMIRKYGAGVEELKKESRAIAPVLKHIHLSDNFGLEHTELPMGMGNFPTNDVMKIFKEQSKGMDKIKKVAEIGAWYQHFQTTPLGGMLQEFGSPIYGPKGSSYMGSGSYFAGYGMNPDIHHSMYGSGFANLPVELGGQMAGRSRVSGAPME